MQLVTWNAEVPEKNCPLYDEIEKDLNIKLNINYVLAANAFDKINTTLAGGDMPDVLMLLNDTRAMIWFSRPPMLVCSGI